MRALEHAPEPLRECQTGTNRTLEAEYREAAKDVDAEADALAWIEALPNDGLEPELGRDGLDGRD